MVNARGTDINPIHVYNSFSPEEKLLVLGLFRNETCFHYIEGTKRSHDKHENRMIYNISDILQLKECTLFNMLKPFTSHTYILRFHLFFIINVNKLWARCYKRSKGLMTSEYYHLSIKASRFIKKI